MNLQRNSLCFTNPFFPWQFDAFLCDFQMWTVNRDASTDLIVDWIELSHLSKSEANFNVRTFLPGPQKREINMAVVLSMLFDSCFLACYWRFSKRELLI